MVLLSVCGPSPGAEASDWDTLEQHFREPPMEARRLTGPLFWLYGDESPEQLERMLEIVAESGNGCFTAESRPHAEDRLEEGLRGLEVQARRGGAETAARHQYADAFAESWGRTMYGGMSKWWREHNVISMGHFMEHGAHLFSRKLCAGNMFQLHKYSDMAGQSFPRR